MRAILDELTNPVIIDLDDDNEPDHLYCVCNPDISLCGHDISGAYDTPEDERIPPERLCVVCDDLIWSPCKFCGKI